MRLLFAILFGSLASGACPVVFQTQSAASLKPTSNSHTVLLKQSNGSYAGYDMADATPYSVLKVTPNFQNQLTVCPLPSVPPSTVVAPQAFAQIPTGGYLFLQRSDLFGTPGAYTAVYALQFDSSLRLVSRSSLTLSAGTLNPGIADTLTLADLNGDGKPDMIAGVGYPHSAGLQVLLGTGGASFQAPVLYSVSKYIAIQSLVVADVNGDNKPDLVVASIGFGSGGAISVFLGNGDGTFQPEKVVTTTTGLLVAAAVGDLNGDGKPDLAFTTNGFALASVTVALGNGDGTFSTPVSYQGRGGAITIGDVNGDGHADIVAGGITILFGDGTGAFPNRLDYSANNGSGTITLADFNGDGKTDIIVGTGASWILSGATVAVLYGRGDGTFSGPTITIVPGSLVPDNGVTAMQSADLDGDGKPDLLSANGQSGITALHGNGDGTFKVTWQHNPRTQENIPGFAGSITIGDFNRDGIPDFAAEIESPSTGMIEVFLGVGDGTFQPPVLIPLGSSIGDYISMVSADFNGDGKPDLGLVTTPSYTGGAVSSTILILLGNGDGTFGSQLVPLTGPGYFTIATGDFNNDGVPDIAVANDGSLGQISSGVSILLGKGDGTFTAAATVPLTSVGYSLTTADFNLDGKLDLAVSTLSPRSPQGGLAILLGTGDGGFQPPISYGLSVNNLVAGDLNGDGVPDLVTSSSYLLGNGDGSFQAPVVGFGGMVMADFNGDGQMDLAAGEVFALLNISHPSTFTLVSAASFQKGPVAPESLASAFGAGFGSSSSITTVSFQDAAGARRSASVFYASPTQVNFEIPPGTSAGLATIVLTNAATSTSFSASAQIAPVAPGLFTLNRAGLVAAYVVRASGGVQTIEPVFTMQNGAVIPAPIDLGAPSDQVYLSLFGTGIRNAASGGVSVRINGVNAPVTYAGPQTVFPGLDQVNVLLPRQLAGAGQAGIVVTAAGHTANTVYAFFR